MLPIEPESECAVRSFNVTQLLNYRRCPRQYYFERVLHVPSADQMAVWNNAEAPEPPANLTATLKGAVIHRFCEIFCPGEDPIVGLRQSFHDVIRRQQAQLAVRLLELDQEQAVTELLPLAENYLASDVFQRITQARAFCSSANTGVPSNTPGL